MSIKLMAAAWDLDIPATEKMVLICLCDHASDAGVCWPSVSTIARKCSKGERTVQGAIKWLRDEGYCQWDDTPGKPHRFTLVAAKICSATPAEIAPPQKLRPAEIAETPATFAQTPAESAPEPYITSNNHQGTRKRAHRVDSFEVPDWVPAEQWDAYCAMRARKKAPVDSYIAKRLFGKLEKIGAAGWDIAKVIDKATLNNWTDLWMPTPGRDDDMRATAANGHAKPAFQSDAEWNAHCDRMAAGFRSTGRERDAIEWERKRKGIDPPRIAATGPPRPIGELIPHEARH